MNRIKNLSILIILVLFLLIVQKTPVTCILKEVTGVSCPGCGMTRAFDSIIHFKVLDAVYYNMLSIPLFVFIIIFIFILSYEVFLNEFKFIPNMLKILSKPNVHILILVSLLISLIINNLKY